MSESINVTIESTPINIELSIEPTSPIQVNFRDIAVPDASVIANRILAENAAAAAALSESAATNAAANAFNAQTNAATSETNASNAQLAAESAQSAAELAQANAETAQATASASEAAAQNSANLALESEVNAGISEVNAAASEAAAEQALSQLNNGYCYLGDQNVNGSWRFFNDAGTLKMEKRVAGTWTTLNEYTI